MVEMKKKLVIILIILFFSSFTRLYPASCKQKPKNLFELKINPMIELDFKSKNEIYQIRKEHISQYPQLAPKGYVPSKKVFGGIASGKPWIGIFGASYYGTGRGIISGPSEESRFIANPYLLIGLDEGKAYTVRNNRLRPLPVYPKPISLAWSKDQTFAEVTFDIKDFWKKKREYHLAYPNERKFILVAYNARDLGFNYLYVVPQDSENVVFLDKRVQPIPLRQYIHSGGTCGFKGGCNNMSPWEEKFRIYVKDLPARAYIKLWKAKPRDINESADMIFVIDMI